MKLNEHLKAGPFLSQSLVDKLRVDPGSGHERRNLSKADEFATVMDLSHNISSVVKFSDVCDMIFFINRILILSHC